MNPAALHPMSHPMMPPSPALLDQRLAIDLSHVSKTYKGKVQALRGIEMRVHRGEIFGLLGPNGAGKSTLVKILMTVIKPTRCLGTMLGEPVGRKRVLGRVGYLPEHHQFSGYLTGAQVLDYYGALCDVPRRVRKKRGADLLDLVGMTAWADKRVKSYSKGMRQRIGVAQALINDPELVLLDEPTDGVDPVGRRDIRAVLMRLKEEGKTVFLNSHLLSELELVCDRVAILVQGLVSSQGTIDELTKDRQCYTIEIAELAGESVRGLLPESLVRSGLAPRGERPRLAKRVGFRGELVTGEWIQIGHNIVRVGTTEAGPVQPLIDALRSRGAVIKAVKPVRPSLEDLFMRAVTDPNTGETLAPGAAKNGGAR